MEFAQIVPMHLVDKNARMSHIIELKGHTVAVDGNSWLERGIRTCALELGQGEETDKYVKYFMRYVKLLLSYEIRPIIVFSGRVVSTKLPNHRRLMENKELVKIQGLEYLSQGEIEQAYHCLCQGLAVTPEMILTVMKECRQIHVDCMVAPYHCNAQIAFFMERNLVECVMTDDLEVLLFGYQKVFFKMSQTGSGLMIAGDKFYLGMTHRREEQYEEQIACNIAIYEHHMVVNPYLRSVASLHPICNDDAKYYKYWDRYENEKMYQLCLGNLNPHTMERMDNWDPDYCFVSDYSIWSRYHKLPPRPFTHLKPPEYEMLDAAAIEKAVMRLHSELQRELDFYKTPYTTEEPGAAAPLPQAGAPVDFFVKKNVGKFQLPQLTRANDDPNLVCQFYTPRQLPRNESMSSSGDEDGDDRFDLAAFAEPADAKTDDNDDLEVMVEEDDFYFEFVEDDDVTDESEEELESIPDGAENIPVEAPRRKRKVEEEPKKVPYQMPDIFKRMKMS